MTVSTGRHTCRRRKTWDVDVPRPWRIDRRPMGTALRRSKTMQWLVNKHRQFEVNSLLHCCSRAVISNKRLIVHQGINDSLSFSVWTIAHAWLTSAPEYSSKTFSLLSPSSCNRSVNRLQTRVVLHCCVCCRAASVLMMSNHETVRAWLREHVYRLLSALVLVGYLLLDFDAERLYSHPFACLLCQL